MAAVSPWALQIHPVAWVLVLGSIAGYAAVIRRAPYRATRRQAACFVSGSLAALVGLTWPLADLAAHWSLSALVIQRMILLLVVPPLVLIGIPAPLLARLTRPAAVDWLVERCTRIPVAVGIVTVVVVGTATVGVVDAQASSLAARAVVDALLLFAGVVLWAPVLGCFPGTIRLSALGKAGYLIVQAIVPTFLSLVWIFARHPLYPPFRHTQVAGLSPLLDQQLAGFIAKLGTIFILGTVAFVVVSRARGEEVGGEEAPLTWADVERHLRRAERTEQSAHRRALRHGTPVPGAGPGVPDAPDAPDASDGLHRPDRPDRPAGGPPSPGADPGAGA